MPVTKKSNRLEYTLIDYNKVNVTGSRYPKELQEISDNYYRIEKVLQRRILPDIIKE